MKFSFLIIVVVTAVVCNVSAQQMPQFTQYMFNGLVINPATAGSDEALSLTFIERIQWAGVEKAPETQTLSVHSLFRKSNTGIGLTIVNDRIGVHRNLNIMGAYAYHMQLSSESLVSLGLQGGLYNRKSDYSSLQGSTSFDPRTGTAIASQTFFDFGAGIYFRRTKFEAGLSVPNLIPHEMKLGDSSPVDITGTTLILYSKYKFKMNDYVSFQPNFLLLCLQSLPISYDMNFNVVYKEAITAGLSYRKKESIGLLIKTQLTPQLQFGYSYDHPVGIVSQLANGSHEFMIQYLFRYSESNVISPR